MNIAFCYESVIPARGGCETYIADLAHRMTADGHGVHIYARECDASALPARVSFHPIAVGSSVRFMRPWRFAAAAEQALRHAHHDVIVGFVKTWYQDVILPQGGLHAASADYNLRKYRQPWIRWLARGLKWIDPAFWSFRALERRQFLGANRPEIVVASHMVREHFDHYLGISGNRIHVIPNAIDPRRFVDTDWEQQRAELRHPLRVGPDAPVGLFVGHNYRLKGLDPLLRAVQAMPDTHFHLLVCGSPRTTAYERQARRLGIADRVHFLGFCADVRRCFFAADFLVHPTFYDPCSLVVLEALACGLPVITTRCNGAGELLHPPLDGYVLDDPQDHATLARQLAHWCDPVVRAASVPHVRRTASQWTFEHHYQALLGVLQATAARKRPPRSAA
jgi:UDP-glucose:(heptosyl)LPS alpha-1,3-glucosyltransferase